MTYKLTRLIIPLFLFLSFSGCKTNTYLSKVDTERITVDQERQADVDAKIAAMIDPYKTELDAKMNKVIGILTTTLEKARPQSTLGNWMCDVIHERAQHYYGKHVDFAHQNYGGIRINNISAGDITTRNIYELMPFDNKIVIVELQGDIILKMINHLASNGGRPFSGSLNMKVDKDGSPTDIMIAGKPIDLSKTYIMALPDYVANGGGGCDFLKPLKQIETGWNVRAAIIDYLETYKEPISVVLDNRIVIL